MSSDVLVTGARGFVGRQVVSRAEAQGLDVVAAEGDLRDSDAVARQVAAHRPRMVIHLASVKPQWPVNGWWAALAEETAMASSLAAALNAHAPEASVLVPGSAAQYGYGRRGAIAEDEPTRPVSPYGSVKCALERAWLSPLAGALRVIWTRSFNHVGPGQQQDAPVAGWARQIALAEETSGGTVRVGNLDSVRDFLDVRDVADAYLALVGTDASGVVNVCSGTPVRLRHVTDRLSEMAEATVTIEQDPALVREMDPPEVVGDPQRLVELTGWRPSIALDTSLADTLTDWRERVRAGKVEVQADV